MQTKLLLGLHLHQPIDNFDSVVYEAIAKSYRPFIETVKNDDWFRFSLHISGWLFEFIKQNDKKLFSMIKSCYDKGMIEFFSGGFYEPVLAAIPKRDRALQIKKMNKFLKDNFGVKPRGLWLTERVWSDCLVESLVDEGIEYIVTDDYHFVAAGFSQDRLDGYYMTEESGNKLGVFPISKKLRYLIPFKKPSISLAELEKVGDSQRAAVLFDDGEKFGLWPKTYEWVYEKGWLREFLDLLKSSKSVVTAHYGEYFDSSKPLGIAYLPSASYYEMGEWSLSGADGLALESIRADVAKEFGEECTDKFVKGGIWKNFFSKYPESNRIHKNTVRLSKIAQKEKNAELDELVLKSEANDALWHGVFGGIYLPNLRDNCYRYILEAQRCLEVAKSATIEDENFDGYLEARLGTETLTALFETKNGAQLTEFGWLNKLYNFQNTLSRRFEGYHKKLLEEKGEEPSGSEDGIDTIHDLKPENLEALRGGIFYDWYQKNSFVEHICDDSFCKQSFLECRFNEYGDFANQPFEFVRKKSQSVLFEREGGIYISGQKYATKVSKKFSLKKSELGFEVAFDTECDRAFRAVVELNFHFNDYEALLLNGKSFDIANGYEEQAVSSIRFADTVLKSELSIELDGCYDAIAVPISTISQNESGAESCIQGVSIALVLPLVKKALFSGKISVKDI